MNQNTLTPARAANQMIASMRSGRLTAPRGASALTSLHKQHVNRAESEAWLMVYLDVITLLLVFFILMLTYANTDLLGGETKPQEPLELTAGEVEQPEPDSPPYEQTHGEVTKAQPDLELAKRLQASLTEKELDEGLEIKVEPGRVNLQMPEKILFQTGRADLIGRATEVMAVIVPILLENNLNLSIEGHSDNVPIYTERFPSNWELSTARASTVIRFLHEKGIPLNRMRAVGYADTLPIASNDTPEGRSANRRVTLVIHLDNSEQFGAAKPAPAVVAQ
jgi:chemotaxis protein MotB